MASSHNNRYTTPALDRFRQHFYFTRTGSIIQLLFSKTKHFLLIPTYIQLFSGIGLKNESIKKDSPEKRGGCLCDGS
jgi:hypothetical protein